jgi:hypothetical protein
VKVNGPDVVLLSLVSFSAQQTLIFPVISLQLLFIPALPVPPKKPHFVSKQRGMDDEVDN